jgi:hypothetical protein
VGQRFRYRKSGEAGGRSNTTIRSFARNSSRRKTWTHRAPSAFAQPPVGAHAPTSRERRRTQASGAIGENVMTLTFVEQSERIVGLLNAVPSLHEAFDAEPQVLIMPTAPGAPDQWTVFIGLFMKEQALTVERLTSTCCRIVTELAGAHALPKGTGLEIMCCASRGVTAERVLRLQVQRKALQAAKFLKPDDLMKAEPGKGIKSALYRNALSKSPGDGA